MPRLIWAAKSSRGANCFLPSQFPCYTFLRRPNHAKLTIAWPKTVKTHNLPRLIWAAKRSRGAKFFHPQPFPTLHVSYGVPTTQKRPLPGQNQSKHTICPGKFALQKVRAVQTFFIPGISHVTRFYGVPTTQKWPLAGQKQSKHTICHV